MTEATMTIRMATVAATMTKRLGTSSNDNDTKGNCNGSNDEQAENEWQ